MKSQRGLISTQMIMTMAVYLAMVILVGGYFLVGKRHQNSYRHNYEAGILLNAMVSYYGANCRAGAPSVNISRLVQDGFITMRDIEGISGAVHQLYFSGGRTASAVVEINISLLAEKSFILGGEIPGSLSGNIATFTRQLYKPSDVGYSYDALYVQECGK
jgi:hypothetical protein